MNNLEDYFKTYSAAYLTFDSDTLLPFFHYPCIVHDLGGVHLLDSDQATRDYEQPMLEQLKANDVSVINSVVKQSTFSETLFQTVNCTVAYDLRDSLGQVVLDFDYDYKLLKQADSWRILFAQIRKIRMSRL